jgi:hypothetical protein
MNYGNIPQYTMMQFYIPPDAILWFRLVMIVFVACFFVSLHWKVHVMQHGFPPMYVLRLSEWWNRLRRGA